MQEDTHKMAQLGDVIAYFVWNTPVHWIDLDVLFKLAYLADWQSCLETGHQLTNAKWSLGSTGPESSDIVAALSKADQRYFIVTTTQPHQEPRFILRRYLPFVSGGRLSDQERNTLDIVIRNHTKMQWSEFLRYLISTYPLLVCDRYQEMDLKNLAAEYKLKISTSNDTASRGSIATA